MSVVLDVISLHFLKQGFRKVSEEKGFLRIFHSPTKRTALVVDSHIGQRVISVLIHDVVNHFESLAKAEDRPRDVVLVFLIYAVLKNLLRGYVVGVQCSILQYHI